MKIRDFVIVAAFLALVGFAAADALRGEGDPETRAPSSTAAAATAPGPPPAAATEPQRAGFQPIGAGGWLVFTDADDCRVRQVDVGTGVEVRLPVLGGDCTLWAPPAASRIAYGLGGSDDEGVPFRFVDLARPEDPGLGGYTALFGFLVFSDDGRRAAWCGESRAGYDLELGGPVRRLRECPAAYTPTGEIAFTRENRLVVDGKTQLVASAQITSVHYGFDGSTLVAVDGRRLERWKDGSLRHELDLPAALHGRLPIPSPDNCAALFRREGRLDLVDVGCFRGDAPQTFFDRDATWSPDGRWIAVAEERTIAFRSVGRPSRVVRWLAAAAQLAWQR